MGEATAEGSVHMAAMVEAATAGSVLTLQGFVHVLTNLVRVTEVVEGMKTVRLPMAEASVNTLTDFVRALHPVVQKTAGFIRVA